MSAARTFRIAAIPGDGVGREVAAAGREVLDAGRRPRRRVRVRLAGVRLGV